MKHVAMFSTTNILIFALVLACCVEAKKDDGKAPQEGAKGNGKEKEKVTQNVQKPVEQKGPAVTNRVNENKRCKGNKDCKPEADNEKKVAAGKSNQARPAANSEPSRKRGGIIKTYTRTKTTKTARTERMLEIIVTLPKWAQKTTTTTLLTEPATTTSKSPPPTTAELTTSTTSTSTSTTTTTTTTTSASTTSPTTTEPPTTTSTSTSTSTTSTSTTTTEAPKELQCRWLNKIKCDTDGKLSSEYTMNRKNSEGAEATLPSSNRKIFLSAGVVKYGIELGIYDYCCKLGMKVFEPATLSEFQDYYDMTQHANTGVITKTRTGLIGETYRMNSTHHGYCSTNRLVPYVWKYHLAPLGMGYYLVFKGMKGGDPDLMWNMDTFRHDNSKPFYDATKLIPGITYFACE